MSGLLDADGFIAEKPELTVVGAKRLRKREVDVVWTRRAFQNGEWQSVWERATFVAWNDLAEECAERLEKGMDVRCVGEQQTSSWTPQGAVKPVYRTKHDLVYWTRIGRRKTSDAAPPAEAPRAPPAPEPRAPAAPRPPASPPADTEFDGDPFPGPAAEHDELPSRSPPAKQFIDM